MIPHSFITVEEMKKKLSSIERAKDNGSEAGQEEDDEDRQSSLSAVREEPRNRTSSSAAARRTDLGTIIDGSNDEVDGEK